MKRIETLVKEARRELHENQYAAAPVRNVSRMEIARALDRIREAEATLRRAFE